MLGIEYIRVSTIFGPETRGTLAYDLSICASPFQVRGANEASHMIPHSLVQPPLCSTLFTCPLPFTMNIKAGICAHAASLLTAAKGEFVRQALIAPDTVAVVLATLYDGGGGDGKQHGDPEAHTEKLATACRLNSARVLNAIFSEADACDVARCACPRLKHTTMQSRVAQGGLLSHVTAVCSAARFSVHRLEAHRRCSLAARTAS